MQATTTEASPSHAPSNDVDGARTKVHSAGQNEGMQQVRSRGCGTGAACHADGRGGTATQLGSTEREAR